MRDRSEEFRHLLGRLKAGDESAAEEIVDQYGPHLINAIRRRVRSRRVLLVYSTEDCLQSVWGSIFANRDRVVDMESPQHLMRFLARVATNKLIDKQRQVNGRKHDRGEVIPLAGTETDDQFQLATNDPTPSAMVSLEEEWELRTRGLSDEKRTILELRRQGHTSEEIAARTEYSERGVRYVLKQFRDMFVERASAR